MNILSIDHPDITLNPDTSLVSQANSGDTTITVLNTKGFSINQCILIGEEGSENAERVKTHPTTAPTDTVITLASGLKFSHTTDEPVTFLDFDQIEIYRANSKGGSYTLIDTIDIDWSELKTTYRDENGLSGNYYRFRYKNSISGNVSSYSVEIPASGFSSEALYSLVEKTLTLFGSQSERLLDKDEITDDLNEGYRILVNRIIDLGIDYYVKKGDKIPFVADQENYDLPNDFVRPRRFWFCYNGSNEYPADPLDFSLDHPDRYYSETEPKYFFRGKQIVVRPVPTSSAGYILPYYVYMPPKLENDDDEPDLPKGYASNLVNWALFRAFLKDNKFEKANYYKTLFENQAEMMLLEIKKRTPEWPKKATRAYADLDDGYPFD